MSRFDTSLQTRCIGALCTPWAEASVLINHRTGRVRAGRQAEFDQCSDEQRRTLTQMIGLPHAVRAHIVKWLARRGMVDDGVLQVLCTPGTPLGEVDLRDCRDVTDAGVRAIATTGDRVRSLNLQPASCGVRESIGFDSLSELLPAARWLHTLKLGRCLLVDDKVCDLVRESCPNLRALSLSGCRDVSDDGVESVANLGSLLSLVLSGTAITDHGCHALATGRAARRLTELHLSRTGVTDIGVVPLIESCRQLKTLLLDGVRGVTAECREKLQPPENGRGFVQWTVY